MSNVKGLQSKWIVKHHVKLNNHIIFGSQWSPEIFDTSSESTIFQLFKVKSGNITKSAHTECPCTPQQLFFVSSICIKFINKCQCAQVTAKSPSLIHEQMLWEVSCSFFSSKLKNSSHHSDHLIYFIFISP